jgi:hypothetical protein
MMRDGDEQRAEALREWYVERQLQLTSELERYRYLPDEFGACPEGYEACVPQGGSMDCNEYTPCICLPVGECLGGGGGEDDGGVIEPPPWIEW